MAALEKLRSILDDLVPPKTARRWVAWLRGAVWESPFWRGSQGKFHGLIERSRLMDGVWDRFAERLKTEVAPEDFVSKMIYAILRFFSPITRPEEYPS